MTRYRVGKFGRRVELRSPDVRRAVDDLALEVADLDGILVHESDRAHARRRQIHRRRRSQAARADAEHACGLETLLALDAHFREREVTAVAQHLVAGELSRYGRGHDPDHMIARPLLPLAFRRPFA